MKSLLIIFSVIVVVTMPSMAQDTAPYNIGFSPSSGAPGDRVFISGINFSPVAAENLVYFGSGKAQVVSAQENQLEVVVPATATYGSIQITNTATGLTAFSPGNFLLSFGTSDYTTTRLNSIRDFPTGQGRTYDLCLCDFNTDGKTDVAVANSEASSSGSSLINIFVNNSTIGNAAFTRVDRILSTGNILPTINTTCGDLDGDGQPDLLYTVDQLGVSAPNTVTILQNTSSSSVTFATAQRLTLPNKPDGNFRDSRRMSIKDLDQDGKPEIIVTNTQDPFLFVYRNNSTIGSIAFDSEPIQLAIDNSTTAEAGTLGLDVEDLNDDGFPEVVVTQEQGRDVFIFRNQSEPGNIVFSGSMLISARGNFLNLKLGDLNGDGLKDIALTNPSQSNVTVLLNETTARQIQFGPEIEFATASTPWGLDIGDLNGDGLADIAVASVGSNPLQFSTLINTSTDQLFSMANSTRGATGNTRNVKIGDLDGDGRPDLALSSDQAANLSISLNKNCIVPVIMQENQTICAGSNFRLETTNIAAGSYQWFRDGQPVAGSNSNSLAITQTGRYTVQITTDGTGCSVISPTPVDITVAPGAAANPAIAPVEDVCIGEELTLRSTNTATAYIWTGPNGFEGSGNPLIIEDFSAEKAGTYTLQLLNGSCQSAVTSINVGMKSVPLISIEADEDLVICEGNPFPMKVANFPGYTYQWRQDGNDIPDTNSSTYDATEAGTYTAIISGDNGCSYEADPFVFEAVPRPVSSFVSPDSTCFEISIDFTASSTGDFPLTYSWDFGDGTTASGEIVDNAFTVPGTYNTTLTTGYAAIANCETTFSKSVVVVDVPNVEIEAPQGTEKCPTESVLLSLPTNLVSYQWNTGETTSSIQAPEPGNYSVVAINDLGCEFSDQIDVTNFEGGGIEITSPGSEIINDSIKLEENQKSVDLIVSGGTDYDWTPTDLVLDPTSSMISVFPRDILTVMMVTGTDANGCPESDDISIVNEFITPRTSFSPNGDGFGFDCWEISNTRDLNGCTVYIFDNRGRNLSVTDSPFENDCVWDGTAEGNQVPEGVYFFVMKCEDAQFNRSGSIMLAR